jgi:hypothetical protein
MGLWLLSYLNLEVLLVDVLRQSQIPEKPMLLQAQVTSS